VLIGAQVAALHQRQRSTARARRIASADEALREALCLSALLQVVRAFLAGAPPPTLEALSTKLETSDTLLLELLERLVESGMLLKTTVKDGSAYALAKAPELIRAKDVFDALRTLPSSPRVSDQHSLDATAAQTWQELDRAVEQSPANRSLQELARGGAPQGTTITVPARRLSAAP
jgi:DNA-binding IscR family transcriptional regulator